MECWPDAVASFVSACQPTRVGVQVNADDMAHFLKYAEFLTHLLRGRTVYFICDQADGSICTNYKQAKHYETQALIHIGDFCECGTVDKVPTLHLPTVASRSVASDAAMTLLLSDAETLQPNVLVYSSRQGYRHICAGAGAGDDCSVCAALGGADVTWRVVSDTLYSDHCVERIIRRTVLRFGLEKPRFVDFPDALATLNATLPSTRYLLSRKLVSAHRIGFVVGESVSEPVQRLVHEAEQMLTDLRRTVVFISAHPLSNEKLENFVDVEVFVYFGCPETTVARVLERAKEFRRPVLTPVELWWAFRRLAFEGTYVFDAGDFTRLETAPPEAATSTDGESDASEAAIVAVHPSAQLALLSPKAGLVPFTKRAFQGVDASLAAAEPYKIHQGKSGVASSYLDEGC